ncbi:MAG: rod shape-determining protein MreC [Verrucomicrobiaceae bacterium]|nr:rod shape-determining protein MreC [Verrucomicrobiaceae bacterium]
MSRPSAVVMKKTNLISLGVFVMALVWLFTLENKTVKNIQSKVLGVFGFAHEAVSSATFDNDVINGEAIDAASLSIKYNKDELAQRYSELLKELFQLHLWRGQFDILREENIELKRSLNFVDYKSQQNQRLIAARVINRQSRSWWRTIVIDKGLDEGVVLNSPVMTPVAVDKTDRVEGALVGKVTVVSRSQSTVVLATDVECKVGAYVHGVLEEGREGGLQRVQGILSGAPSAGTDVPHLILSNLPKEADRYGVKAGAKVYSSGIASSTSRGIFPPGLMLGYVKAFEVREIDAVARVDPAIDFNDLSHVFVLLPGAVQDGSSLVADELAPAEGGGAAPADPVVPRARALDDDVD